LIEIEEIVARKWCSHDKLVATLQRPTLPSVLEEAAGELRWQLVCGQRFAFAYLHFCFDTKKQKGAH
jgi:hypothetical protein